MMSSNVGGSFASADDVYFHHDDIVAGDEGDTSEDLPFALSDSCPLSESFIKANEDLALSLAATTISTRSGASSDFSGTSPRSNCHDQTCTSTHESPCRSVDGQQKQPMSHSDPNPNRNKVIVDQPSPVAAAAAEAAAALMAITSSGSSFILQNPLNEDNENNLYLLRRRDSPETASASDAEDTQMYSTGIEPSNSNSLGFSDLMRKASGDTAETFPILQPVNELTTSPEDRNNDTRTTAPTPPICNIFGGATIVPPCEDEEDAENPAGISCFGQQSTQRTPCAPKRWSRYRVMGPSVQRAQLSENGFSVSTFMPPPFTVHEVFDALANPDLLRLWCVPVTNILMTYQGGGGMSARSRSGDADHGREYDGQWFEITTTQLVSPSSSCASYFHKGMSAAKSIMGFPSHGVVKMFLERNRGQVSLSLGPFMGDVFVEHNFSVSENCALDLTSSEHSSSRSDTSTSGHPNSGVMITDTVTISKNDEHEDGSGYSCFLLEHLENYLFRDLSGYMTQAALSLENLCDVVCDGEAFALANTSTTCSGVDFTFGEGGLNEKENDGRTPLLAQC